MEILTYLAVILLVIWVNYHSVFIYLAAVILPFLVKRVLRIKERLPTFIPFWITILFGIFLANVFWENFIFNKIYYEWDRIFPPYTLWWAEKPILDGSGTWIAAGWQRWHLDLVWLIVTLLIYGLSLAVSEIYARRKQNRQNYQRVLLISIAMLLVGTLLLRFTSYIVISSAKSEIITPPISQQNFR